MVRFLLNRNDVFVTIASQELDNISDLLAGRHNCRSELFDVNDSNSLDKLVRGANVVVSLLPSAFHPLVAKACLGANAHLITTSYLSDQMLAYDEAAKKAGLLFLNEIGLDPGIDHMSAVELFERIRSRGGVITGFRSSCGGLPAPESNDNPLGYKFSWSPRGVIIASKSTARYLEEGREVFINRGEIFRHYWTENIPPLGDFEIYPNRDSVHYKDLYKLDQIRTLIRGTIRNPGWCRLLDSLSRLRFLDDTEDPALKGKSLARIMSEQINSSSIENLEQQTAQFLGLTDNDPVIAQIKWLGLFDDVIPTIRRYSRLDILAQQMVDRMRYKAGERDMIVLQHDVTAMYKNGKKERIKSSLIQFGDPEGDSAMAKTVSLPAALAAVELLRGNICSRGVQIPVAPDIYRPVLKGLGEMGIRFDESHQTTKGL